MGASHLKASLQKWLHGITPALFLVLVLAGMLFSTDASANSNCINTTVDINFTDSGDAGVSMLGTGDNPICEMFMALNQVMLGKAAALATIAIIALGAAALFGKISYSQALIVVASIALVFGADTFIQMFNTIDVSITFGDQGSGASYTDPITMVLGQIISTMTGYAGKAVASVLIVIVGIGGLYGKISWIQVLVLVAGIGLMFGALNIVVVFANAIYGTTSLTGFLNALTDYTFYTSIEGDPLGGPFMNVIEFMTGDIGVSLATVCVMAVGFAAMMGRLSWVQAVVLSTGIALVFGAANVVEILMSPLALCTSTSTDAFTQVICGFMEELQGPMGKTLATLAIIIIGILSMLGKISWELGFIVTIGIALIFGADAIVSLFETGMNGVTCGSAVPSAPSTGNAIADVLCYIVMILYGPAGKALATVAVIMMGFGALIGKVSFGQAFVVAAGIAVTFGAPTLTGILLPSASVSGCTVTGGFSSGNLIGDVTFTKPLGGC